ncbi:MAG: hypothetical protein HRU38_21355 [Saccharospirillaceae bacterium]|nr:hypothetical protein [Pseudomonadales bacterium]NRB81177.1 hypothetical protein [Saccharospirillaceae bacterium]
MKSIVLGKNLLTDKEIIAFAQSDQNELHRNVLELQRVALDSAFISSMAIISCIRRTI